jgi:hypothetical protein
MKLKLNFFIYLLKIFQVILDHASCTNISAQNKSYQKWLSKIDKAPEIQALLESIQVHFIDQNITFDFNIIGRFTIEMGDIIDGVRQKISMESIRITTENREFKYENDLYLYTNENSVVFFDFDLYKSFHLRTYLNQMVSKVQRFLIFLCGNVSSTDNITINFYQYHLLSFTDREEIELKILDVNETCGYGAININSFDKATRKWKKELQIYEWLKNYFGCFVFVRPNYGTPDYASLDFLSLPYEIAKMVGRRVNFTVVECDEKGRVIENNKIQTNKQEPYNQFYHDFYQILLFYQEVDEMLTFCLPAFDFVKITFMITPGEPYTNFEKLYLPFDDETWKYLIITFGLSFSLIFIINRFNRNIQNIVYGTNVQTPSFNVVSVFFGIGLVKLPSGNFARIILLIFIYFCLVIRTAYQGALLFILKFLLF